MGEGMKALFLLSLYVLSAWATTEWAPCSVLSPTHDSGPIIPDSLPSFDIDPNLQAQCRYITVPLMYDGSTGETLDIFVKRIFKDDPVERKDQFWILQGGPGGSGQEAEELAVNLLSDPSMHKITVYLPDHRGTGRSNRLECPDHTKIWECKEYVDAKYGDSLHAYTTTSAARDLIRQIDTCRNNDTHPNEKVWVVGKSYGTYWAQRYVNLIETEHIPYQANAIILDAACPMEAVHFSQYDLNTQHAGMSFMSRCQRDVNCRGHFELEDPYTDMYEVWFQVRENTHCAGKIPDITPAKFNKMLANLMSQPITRPLAPALIHRMKRCNRQDIQVIKKLFAPGSNAQRFVRQMGQGTPYGMLGQEGYGVDQMNATIQYWSPVLCWNILFSEMWTGNGAYTPAEYSPMGVQGWTDTSIFATHVPSKMAPLVEKWNCYKRDPYWYQYPKTRIPLLLLHGDLDPATPYPWAPHIISHYTGPKQHLVRVPLSSHVTIRSSPLVGSQSTCGWEIIKSFLYESMEHPDVSCLQRLEPIDFPGRLEKTKEMSRKLWGTRNLWG
eukprot:gnl/Trimastix_PCT/5126.p1 GENE.gnl/Trimastix_PCT/5126~~gnl/Trimastix_PCT/5126.p1  ORF type:complete len:554 (+),score=36.75 gnl/Trimastix_PCT/5126:35-1696(+)